MCSSDTDQNQFVRRTAYGPLGIKTRIEIQTLLIEEDEFYFTNLFKLHNLYILMEFHFVFLKGIFLKSTRPNGHSMKHMILGRNYFAW